MRENQALGAGAAMALILQSSPAHHHLELKCCSSDAAQAMLQAAERAARPEGSKFRSGHAPKLCLAQ